MKLPAETRPDQHGPEFAFGTFRLEPDGTLLRGEVQIHLPPKELAALEFLLNRAGQVVTPAQLKHALWGDVHVTPDSVPRCLSSLRARLEPEQYIQTIYKRGYRLVGPVRRLDSQGACPLRLVIMPFAAGRNIEEHLGAAITEEVISRLTATSSAKIAVLARDSVFTLAGRGLTAAQVGESLHANLVLAGVLLSMPTHFRLRVEMIRVEDGIQIWVEDMLVARDQVLALQSELVQRLVFRLGGELSLAPAASHRRVRPDAYDVFLRGHHEWQTSERHRMNDAVQHLIQATELDPSLIAAQVDLANACVLQEFYGFMAPDVAAKQIRRIADSVPQVSEHAPALLPALGWVAFHIDRDLAKALEMFSASAHLPHDPWITRLRVMLALSRHRFDEAFDWLRAALLVDPYAPWLHARLAWTSHLAGQAKQSVEQAEKCLSLFPDHESSLLYGSMILVFNDHVERGAELAQELVHRTSYFDIGAAIHAYALACGGKRDEAFETLERLQWLGRERFVSRSFIPAAYAALGNIDSAIAELRAADEIRCPWFFQMLADPRLEPLRNRSEFLGMQAELEGLESKVEGTEIQ